ncbi:ankyrin repeat domain-containing protein [Bacillus sp. AK031]
MQQQVALKEELVREFVRAAHGDFDRVVELFNAEPGLLHAVVNWGGDDWESALGAAAHVGRKDIALFLLKNGARIDIFTAAMLGKLSIVQEILAVQPSALHTPGPHGIPLLRHAMMGGEEALKVVYYLEGLMKGDMLA